MAFTRDKRATGLAGGAAPENRSAYRLTGCNAGEFVAIRAPGARSGRLAETETLRDKIQQKRGFTLADVKPAAQRLYKGQDVLMPSWRETEQTCGCRQFGGR